MPRKLLQKSNTLPYHVTARANNKEHFPVPLPDLWRILGHECLFISVVYGVEIQALVLMPNHFHMIITVPEFDLGVVMNEFLKSVARATNRFSGRKGHVFGGPHYRSLIGGTRYYGHALKYVYRNPVRAKICANVESYPYSTLSGVLGLSRLHFPIHWTRVGMEVGLPACETINQLEWLNRPFPNEAEALIRKGLKREVFSESEFEPLKSTAY